MIILSFSCSTDEGGDNPLSDKYSESSGNGDIGGASGIITAGEWNDLKNWSFWKNILDGQEYATMPDYWNIYTNNRISVNILNNNNPVINAKVELLKDANVVWTSRTDNLGMAELWIGSFQKSTDIDIESYSLRVNNNVIDTDLSLFDTETMKINISDNPGETNKVEISFIVDATGSMGDELEFLKEDLKNVIERVKQNNSQVNISTSTVFYRDEEDEYVIRKSEFTQDLDETIRFINKQKADGGGDFPEAVHTALDVGINQLLWSEDAKTRLIFLLLDAPPHYTDEIVEDIHLSLSKACKKGIRIIPVTASGIDKETEFLMRFISVLTNGTYVFITDDSGVGGDHLEPTIGDYQVEYLNNLMIRLINKYSE